MEEEVREEVKNFWYENGCTRYGKIYKHVFSYERCRSIR